MTPDKIDFLKGKALSIRKNIMEMIYNAQSGHPGGSLSLVEILSVLYFHELNIDPDKPDMPNRDRVILSKGHAAPVLYATLAEVGFFPKTELAGLRKINKMLQGHPCIDIPGVDLTTGSLGLGLSGAVGMSLGAKLQGKKSVRIYVILGDGEQNEGQIWEAAMAASHFKLDNLTAIIDRNKYQNDGPTELGMSLEPLADKWNSFGWRVKEIDGNNLEEVAYAFEEAKNSCGKPFMIIAHTVKGYGASYMIDKPHLHYTPPTKEQFELTMIELGTQEK